MRLANDCWEAEQGGCCAAIGTTGSQLENRGWARCANGRETVRGGWVSSEGRSHRHLRQPMRFAFSAGVVQWRCYWAGRQLSRLGALRRVVIGRDGAFGVVEHRGPFAFSGSAPQQRWWAMAPKGGVASSARGKQGRAGSGVRPARLRSAAADQQHPQGKKGSWASTPPTGLRAATYSCDGDGMWAGGFTCMLLLSRER